MSIMYMIPLNRDEPRVTLSTPAGRVSAIYERPPDARALLLLAHGAGAGMCHPFIAQLALALTSQRIAVLRYQFPYMEAGRRRPDPAPTLIQTVRLAAARAVELAPDLPLHAGGKSMGGRMTSLAQAEAPLQGARGLVFFGFPLHPPGKPSTRRAEHLARVAIPMLFLQGDRDKLADLELLRAVCARLDARARLEVIAGADHGFQLLKRSAPSERATPAGLAALVAGWVESRASS